MPRDIAAEIEEGLRHALAYMRGEKPAARLTAVSTCGRYVFRVLWSEEDKEFVGTCAQFPGLSHLDPDQDAALQGIVALVADVAGWRVD